MTLRIGSHPHLLPLFILRHRGVLETALAAHGGVVWTDYDHAGDGAVLLAEQALDVIGTGSTLPVLAHSRGLDIAYLAASPDRAEPCALLAMKAGAHRRLQTLRGARIAGMRGTVTAPFLAGLLLQHDLTLEDITLVDLNGSDAARALREGSVDLWAAIDPWLTAAQDAKKVRCLVPPAGAVRNRSLLWCRERWRHQSAPQVDVLLSVLAENDRWIAGHRQQAAGIIHQHLPGSAGVDRWLAAIRNQASGFQPVTPALLSEQQRQADDLLAARFIPQPLTISVAAEPCRAYL